LADVQRLAEEIAGDKSKLEAYCTLGKVHDEIQQAIENNDLGAVEAVTAKTNALEQTLGPEYDRVIDGLDQIDLQNPAGQVRIDDLMPDGERIAGADVPNGRFSAVRRRPGDGIIRPGELDVGTVTKCDDHGIVRADHIEPSAAARQSERIIAAQNVRAATGAIQRRRLAGTYEGCSSSFK
jgi:hypothetical protein